MAHKILVIDDEPTYREILLDALKQAGYGAREAENGTRGLEVAQEWAPDLILCDLMMPGLSGYETFVALRNDPATKSIPFVFLTAMADRTSRERAYELGVVDFIEKPFSMAHLLTVVEAKLKKSRK